LTAAIRTPASDLVPESDDPAAPPLFLRVDDDVSLAQVFGQTRILTLQLLIFFFQWIVLETLDHVFVESAPRVSPPMGQQRRVQTCAAQQSANAAWCSGSRFSLREDALFVLSRVGAPLGFGNHFGIRRRDRPGVGARFACRSTALRQPKPQEKGPH
jgi:hypothetical protein